MFAKFRSTLSSIGQNWAMTQKRYPTLPLEVGGFFLLAVLVVGAPVTYFLNWPSALLVALPLGLLGSRLWAAPADTPRFLLVFLRGAYDASTLLQPLDGASRTFYEEARPRLAVPRPDGSATGALALDSDWALAPAVQESLGPLWRSQQLAFVPFAGNDDLSRSHFETQDTVELGLGTGWRGARTGLLNRLAGELGLPVDQAVAFEAAQADILLELAGLGRRRDGRDDAHAQGENGRRNCACKAALTSAWTDSSRASSPIASACTTRINPTAPAVPTAMVRARCRCCS